MDLNLFYSYCRSSGKHKIKKKIPRSRINFNAYPFIQSNNITFSLLFRQAFFSSGDTSLIEMDNEPLPSYVFQQKTKKSILIFRISLKLIKN
jgi:hypothetical protein